MQIVWTLCILTQKIALCILPRHYAKWPISHIAHNIYRIPYLSKNLQGFLRTIKNLLREWVTKNRKFTSKDF